MIPEMSVILRSNEMSCSTLQIHDDLALEIDEEIVLLVEVSSEDFEIVKIAERALIIITIEDDDSKQLKFLARVSFA